VKQRVLVLDAGGYIGKRVIQALAASDWAEPIAANGHATNPEQLRTAMQGVSGVVNCVVGSAGIVSTARAVFAAAAQMPERPRVVHLSSMAVYGAATGDLDETAWPEIGLSPYGIEKRDAERLATPDLNVVILRQGLIYGPEIFPWSGRIARLLYARRLGDLGAAGDGYCNLVYIDDAVEVIVRALRYSNIEGKIFNLSLPEPPTWNEYLIRYARSLGAVPVARIGKRRLAIESKILAPPQKIAEMVAARLVPRLEYRMPQAIPPSLVRLFGQSIRMRVEAVETALEMKWTAVEQGLSNAALYYRTR
jgi:2-alkyl-3-oxoalkanoate reductase